MIDIYSPEAFTHSTFKVLERRMTNLMHGSLTKPLESNNIFLCIECQCSALGSNLGIVLPHPYHLPEAFRCHSVLINHAKQKRKGHTFHSPSTKARKQASFETLFWSETVWFLLTTHMLSQLTQHPLPRNEINWLLPPCPYTCIPEISLSLSEEWIICGYHGDLAPWYGYGCFQYAGYPGACLGAIVSWLGGSICDLFVIRHVLVSVWGVDT